MNKLLHIALIPLVVFIWSAPTNADTQTVLNESDALALVQPFYDFLGGDTTADKVRPSYSTDWKSYYSNTGFRDLDATLGFVGGPLQKMIPDLNWEIKDIMVTQANEIIVRGQATGTPAGDNLMGRPAGGKGFSFMSIDIHTVADGKITKTYHVEDWKAAFEQIAE